MKKQKTIDMTESKNKKIRIQFLAWGYSIHAYRRLKLFIDDPRFEVQVVSTYEYNFDRVQNVLLDGLKTPAKDRDISPPEEVELLNEFLENVKPGKETPFQREITAALHDYKILKNATESFRPEIVFLQTLVYPCYLAFFLPRTFKMMITFWNGDVTWWAQWNGIERYLKKELNTYGMQAFDGITVNSEEAQKGCLSYGAPTEKVQLIRYPGVDIEKFAPGDQTQARQTIGIDTTLMVFCPRGLGSYFNSDIILEAAGIVCKKYKDAVFLMMCKAGDQIEREKLQKRARQLSIEKNLMLLGPIPWEKMPAYYRAADVMVSISSSDSLPNCMLESMACKVPVIMGDIQSIRDWIPQKYNNFLTPPRDPEALAKKIIQLIEEKIENLEEFIEESWRQVDAEVNSKKNIARVKDYVIQLAEQERKSKSTLTVNRYIRQKYIYSQLYFLLGKEYFLANNWRRAGSYLRKYLKWALADPEPGDARKRNLSEAYFFLGELQRLQKRGYWRYYLKKSLEQSDALEQRDERENYRIASINKRLKNYKAAENGFLEIIKKNQQPGLVGGAYFHLGEIEYTKRNIGKAREMFKSCTMVISGHQKALEYLELLGNVKN